MCLPCLFQERVTELKHKYWVKMGYVGFYPLTERKDGLCYFSLSVGFTHLMQ